MSKKNTIPAILPDARLMARYDECCREVEAALEGIRLELRAAGMDDSDLATMSAAFTEGYIESATVNKLASSKVDGPARELLESLALAKVQPLAARIDELRQDISGAGFQYDGAAYHLNLKATDIAPADGVLKIRPEHRQSFVEANTRFLTEEEQHAFKVFYDAIPKLQELRADGWHVLRILEPFCPHLDFLKPSGNSDDLARAVVTFRKPQNK